MHKIIANEIYSHRGYWITRLGQGIVVDGRLEIFRTFADARRFIDKIMDGTNDREPRIIGYWREEIELEIESVIHH